MVRVFKDPLIISAMIISFIMALFVNIPILIILFFISFFNVLRCLYNSRILNKLIIVLISIFVCELSLINYNFKTQRNLSPIVPYSVKGGSINVLKDSTPSEYGYFTIGVIFKIYTKQIKTKSSMEVVLYSKYPLYKGQVLDDCLLAYNNKIVSTNIKKREELKFSNNFYKIRYNIVNSLYYRVHSSLFVALFLGSKIWVEPEVINNFRSSGCSHILALSGFHVAIISFMFLIVFRIFFTGSKILVFIMLLLTFYILLAGVTASLLRSVLMFLIGVIFKLMKKEVDLLEIVSLSLIIITIFMPEDFYTLSFKLSYLALIGIIILGTILNELPFVRVIPFAIRSPLSASIAAILMTSLLSFNNFGTIYPVGIIASIIISPLVTIFIWLSIIGIVIPPMLIISFRIEQIIYYLAEFFAGKGEIQSSSYNSLFITFIIIIIPVILIFINYYRRLDAGRFNIKFKL